jgi:hypothetical protein
VINVIAGATSERKLSPTIRAIAARVASSTLRVGHDRGPGHPSEQCGRLQFADGGDKLWSAALRQAGLKKPEVRCTAQRQAGSSVSAGQRDSLIVLG